MRLRPMWTYLFVAAGGGFVRVGGNQGRLEPGINLLLPPWRLHAYGSERPWSSVFIHFGGVRASRLVGRIAGAPWPLLADRDPAGTWRLLQEMILECRKRGEAVQPILSAKLTQLLIRFREQWRKGSAVETPGEGKVFDSVEKWMRENLKGQVSVAELAAKAGFSPSHFSRIWKRRTGRSPVDYLIDLRLLRARELLSQTALSVRAIAERTGFEDQLYFSRLFHRRIGLPPSTYRENTRLR